MLKDSATDNIRMSAKILDGKLLSISILDALKQKIVELPAFASTPKLVILQVAGDSASVVYIKQKLIAAEKIGIQAQHLLFPSDVTLIELEECLSELNQDDSVHGILLQLPLPQHLSNEHLLNCIDPKKDVDGLTAYNLGRLLQQQPQLIPCTSNGIIRLLQHYEIDLAGKDVVILNSSKLVGRPLAMQLLAEGATVTLCNSKTKHLAEHVRSAEIIVSATGQPHVIPSDWLTPGVVIVDVGVHRIASGTLVGDFEFSSAAKIAGWITPVPGGVGPMTVALLMENVWLAYAHRSSSAR